MSGLLLVAFFASALNPGRAWSDRSGWEDLPVVALSGVDGTSAAPAEVKARWNDQWLFFEFVCRDAALIAPGRVVENRTMSSSMARRKVVRLLMLSVTTVVPRRLPKAWWCRPDG